MLVVISREDVMEDSKSTKKLSFLTGLCLNMLSSGQRSDRGVMMAGTRNSLALDTLEIWGYLGALAWMIMVKSRL